MHAERQEIETHAWASVLEFANQQVLPVAVVNIVCVVPPTQSWVCTAAAYKELPGIFNSTNVEEVRSTLALSSQQPVSASYAKVGKTRVTVMGTNDPACVVAMLSAVDNARRRFPNLFVVLPSVYHQGPSGSVSLFLGLTGRLDRHSFAPVMVTGELNSFGIESLHLAEIAVEPIGHVLIKLGAVARFGKILIFNAHISSEQAHLLPILYHYKGSAVGLLDEFRELEKRKGLIGIRVEKLGDVVEVISWVERNVLLATQMLRAGMDTDAFRQLPYSDPFDTSRSYD